MKGFSLKNNGQHAVFFLWKWLQRNFSLHQCVLKWKCNEKVENYQLGDSILYNLKFSLLISLEMYYKQFWELIFLSLKWKGYSFDSMPLPVPRMLIFFCIPGSRYCEKVHWEIKWNRSYPGISRYTELLQHVAQQWLFSQERIWWKCFQEVYKSSDSCSVLSREVEGRQQVWNLSCY